MTARLLAALRERSEPAPHDAVRPLYARVLRLRHLAPGKLLCALFFEGSIVLAMLLAFADLVSWWGVLATPATVAAMVKLNDVVAGRLPDPHAARRPRSRSGEIPTFDDAVISGYSRASPVSAEAPHGAADHEPDTAVLGVIRVTPSAPAEPRLRAVPSAAGEPGAAPPAATAHPADLEADADATVPLPPLREDGPARG
ncbi:hypothetical protein [Cryptosporangium minutisporangium]|uniref:Uncharacterized protein n=1 Tax=Cryptosporangium minutisporangium TaxID=113569 RepID=A0ABP6TCG5_9ACTN